MLKVVETAKGSEIQLGPLCLRLMRTLRVPQDGKTYLLPAGLGT